MNFFSPAEVAGNYIRTGKGKVGLSVPTALVLAMMAGAFIGLAGVGSTTAAVSVGIPSLEKLVKAVVFPAGLTMVLVAGSELFTGNCLLTIPLLRREITGGQMIKNWIVVWIGNLIGSVLVAGAVVACHQFSLFDNGMAVSVISTAVAKTSLSFGDAFIRGILCNFLVCIAVWISFAAKDVAGKIIGLFFPIMLFVLCGFEHCVANMYYISAGLFAKLVPAYADAAAAAGIDVSNLTVGRMFGANLLPSTLGNIVGGAVFVGIVYYGCYLKKKEQ